MIINLSPVASSYTTKVSLDGLVLTIDDTEYDLSVIPEGGQAEGENPFFGITTRDEVTIQYHYDSTLAEPHQSVDKSDYTFDVLNGEVPCPIKWREK